MSDTTESLRADNVRDFIRRELQSARLARRSEEAVAIEEAMANRIATALERLDRTKYITMNNND